MQVNAGLASRALQTGGAVLWLGYSFPAGSEAEAKARGLGILELVRLGPGPLYMGTLPLPQPLCSVTQKREEW